MPRSDESSDLVHYDNRVLNPANKATSEQLSPHVWWECGKVGNVGPASDQHWANIGPTMY